MAIHVHTLCMCNCASVIVLAYKTMKMKTFIMYTKQSSSVSQ